MTKRQLTKLLNTMFAVQVKEAIEAGELGPFNLHSWTTQYNDGFESESLYKEVEAIFDHYYKYR